MGEVWQDRLALHEPLIVRNEGVHTASSDISAVLVNVLYLHDIELLISIWFFVPSLSLHQSHADTASPNQMAANNNLLERQHNLPHRHPFSVSNLRKLLSLIPGLISNSAVVFIPSHFHSWPFYHFYSNPNRSMKTVSV